MAQAVYTDPNAPSKRKAAQLQQQAADRIAARTAERTPAPSGPQAAQQFNQRIDASKLRIDADLGETQRAQARLSTPRTAVNPTPGASTQSVHPADLTAAERRSFDAQSNGRFSQTAGQTPAMPRSVPARPVPSIADGLEAPAPRVAAAAAPEAAAVGAKPRIGRGKAIGGTAALLTGLYAAAESTGRSTSDYRRRLGLPEKGPDGLPGLAADVGVRIAGTARDAALGAVDGLVIAPGNAVARIAQGFGADPNGAFGREHAYVSDAEDVLPTVAQGGTGGVPAKPDFSNVTSGSGTVQGRTPAQQRQADNDGITPVADRTGAADEVLGTFQGRQITRAQSDALAGNQSFGGPTTSITDGLEGGYRAPTGGGGSGVAAHIGGSGTGAEARVKDLTDSSTAAGKVYAELSRDKTPTGKRMAGQFADAYVGTGTAERGQDKDLERAQGNDATLLQRGREGDAAQIEQERVRGASQRKSTPQYVFNDDGTVGQISDGLLTPVTTPDGSPAKVSSRKAQGNPKSNLEQLAAQEELVTKRIGSRDDYADEDEYQAAREKALQGLMQELGIGADLNG